MLFFLQTMFSCECFFMAIVISVVGAKAPVSYVFPTEGDLKDTSAAIPLGYTKEYLRHPVPKDGYFHVFVGELEDAAYLELRVEMENKGASMCLKDDALISMERCGTGCFTACYTPPALNLTFSFSCKSSCSSSSMEPYYYRFVKSAQDASDTWCTDRVTEHEFPSDLSSPPKVPLDKKTTPPTKTTENDSSSSSFRHSYAILVASFALVMVVP